MNKTSLDQIGEAGDAFAKLALYAAGAIAAGVVLWLVGKFLCAQVLLVWGLIILGLWALRKARGK